MTSSPSVVKPPTIKGGTKVTISKPATTAAPTATSTNSSATTTPREDPIPTPSVEEKKLEDAEPEVKETPAPVEENKVEDEINLNDDPELEFDNYDIDKELLEGGQADEHNEEGDIVEFIDDAAHTTEEHNDSGEDTEFPLEPHEQILALEDQ